ncbi:MAG: hypothetical protein JWN24_745 [Phycisphaerales bacterium]|nr:hypothetical protein [Phycisphaerales bacterium]
MPQLDYQNPKATSRATAYVVSIAACAIGLAGNAIVALATLVTLGPLPPGTFIRPMGLAVLAFNVAVATALVGVPLGIVGIIKGRRKASVWMTGLAGALLSLMPIFTFAAVNGLIISQRGLLLEG